MKISSISWNKKISLVKKIGSRLALYVFMIAFSYVLLYPLLYIVVNSFKSTGDYFNPTIQWIPINYTFQNIKLAAFVMDFWVALKNTLIYEIVAAGISIVSCAVAAYGLARFEFKGKKILMGAMMLNILVPSAMIIIPSYINYSYLDLFGILGGIGKLAGQELRPSIIDSPLVFYLPAITSVGLRCGLYIYIYVQFFRGLPKELEEAAWIDGAGHWKTFLTIIVPSSSVAFVTVSIFAIIWHWCDYYLPQMYLSSSYPLSVELTNLPETAVGALRQYTEQADTNNISLILLAGCLLFLLPLLIFYLIVQKKFVASVASSGIVG